MQTQEFDTVIRNIGTPDQPKYQLVIVGHEDEFTFTADTSMGCIRQMNMALYTRSYENNKRCNEAVKNLQVFLRKEANIPSWQFWRKVPQHMRNQMNSIVKSLNSEFLGLTYEESAEKCIELWNERKRKCENAERYCTHECSTDCYRNFYP